MDGAVRSGRGGSILEVRVKPNSSREALEGVSEGRLVVRLTAPPAEGRANRALTRLIARAVGLPPSSVEVVRGGASRNKSLLLKGWFPTEEDR